MRWNGPWIDLPDDLADRIDPWADQCHSVVEAWFVVAEALGSVPTKGCRAATDAWAFREAHPTAGANLEHAPGQFATRYVAGMAQHVLAVESLLRGRQVTLAPWAVIRAELELAGRVGWLLAPMNELVGISADTRVARFLAEAVTDLNERVAKGESMASSGALKTLTEALGKLSAEATSLDPEADLDFHAHGGPKKVSVSGQNLPSKTKTANGFAKEYLGIDDGVYGFFSRLTHPSFVEFDSQTAQTEEDGVTRRDFVIAPETIEFQAKMTCLLFYKAAQLVCGYYDLDPAPLESWAAAAPGEWFREAGDVS